MARYNTAFASASISGSSTISSPSSGAFTELTGVAPYTVTVPNPVLFPGQNQTFYNSTSGTVTLTTLSGAFIGTGGSGTNTVSIYAGNVVSITSDGTNYVVISEDGSALVATTGSFSGNVTMDGGSATVTITPNSLSINPSTTGTIDRMNIGATTRGSGAFNTLAADSQVTFSGNIASTNTNSGTVVITGGLGVSGTINATSVSASLTGTIQTAAQPNITSVGTLTGLTLQGFTGGTSTSNVSGFNKNLVIGGAYNQPYNSGNAVLIHLSDYSNDTSDNVYPIYCEDENNVVDFFLWAGSNGTGLDKKAFFGGNVGIGTTSPSSKLTVNAPWRLDGLTNSLGAAVISGPISDSPSYTMASNAAIFRIQGSNATNCLQFGVGSSGYNFHPWIQGSYDNTSGGVLAVGSKDILLQPLGGYVGIGTTNPSYKLDVVGSASPDAWIRSKTNNVFGGSAGVTAENSSGTQIAIQINSPAAPILPSVPQLKTDGASPIALVQGATVSLYIDTSFNVGIGQSSGITRKLDVNGTTRFRDNTYDKYDFVKKSSYDWHWLARRYDVYAGDIRTNISTYFWNTTAQPLNIRYLHTNDLNNVNYIGENIWGDVHQYKAWAITYIYVVKYFAVTNATLNGDDPYALYINKTLVAGADSCCNGVAYSYNFYPGWYRIELIYSEGGGGHFVQLGWNPKNYTDYIAAMTPFGHTAYN